MCGAIATQWPHYDGIAAQIAVLNWFACVHHYQCVLWGAVLGLMYFQFAAANYAIKGGARHTAP